MREAIAKISFSRCPWNFQPQVIAEMRDLQRKLAKPKSERECMRLSKDQWKIYTSESQGNYTQPQEQPPLLTHHPGQGPWSTSLHIFIPFSKWSNSFWVLTSSCGDEEHSQEPLTICSLIIIKEMKAAEMSAEGSFLQEVAHIIIIGLFVFSLS